MRTAPPIFAKPGKRLCSTVLDVVVSSILGWCLALIVTLDPYIYRHLHFILPPACWAYETICLHQFGGFSMGRRLLEIQVVSALDNPKLTLWQALLRPGIRVILFVAFVLYIKPEPPNEMDVALIPFFIELALLFTFSSLTIADIVARTRVVNIPTPEPHRAPAGPMYSETDKEFGYPPRKKK